jgi:hypothetical protein
MRFISRLKGFFNPKPQLSFSRNGPPLDPGKSHEFLIVVNFENEGSAMACEASLAHLKLATKVKGLQNGRWNVNITFTELADAGKVAAIKDPIEASAMAHGGKILLFTAQSG